MPADSEPCVSVRSCSTSSIRWASFAIRFRPIEAADPLILCAVPIRFFKIVAVASAIQRQQGAGQSIQRRLALVDEDRQVFLRNLAFVPHVLQGIAERG